MLTLRHSSVRRSSTQVLKRGEHGIYLCLRTGMPVFNELTVFDLAVVLLVLVFILRGAWIGFMRQLAAFFALVGSYFIAAQYAAQFLPLTGKFVTNPKFTFLAGFAVLFLVSALVFSFLGKVLHRVMQISMLGWFDRLLGVALGGVKAFVAASLLFMILASSLSATNELLSKSKSALYLKKGSAVLQAVINDPRLRSLFLQKEPAILNQLLPAKNEQQGKRVAE